MLKKKATMGKPAYALAGVDIDLGNKVKAELPRLLASTKRPGVLGRVGGFGGLFALDTRKYRQPILVSSVDGVGTKLKVAFAMGRHDTIGQDLVNHCVNDIAVLGAEPLFFLDYLGTGKLQPNVFLDIVRGFATACATNGCALIGGETAQMPGFYRPGEYDACGAIVGVVEKARMLTGKRIEAGDLLVGIASNGLHTNGYSLARKVLFEELKLRPDSWVEELDGTVGDELLKVHRGYWPVVRALLKRLNRVETTPALKGLVHITGGGFIDNLPRVLPPRCDAVVRTTAWEPPPVFRLIARAGKVAKAEMYQVFNMGVGLVAIVGRDHIDAALRTVRAKKQRAWIIGEIRKGEGKTDLVD